jgi:cytochrome d ubiquinol oxidase subunit II
MIDYGIDLNLTWFILVGVLLAGYAILDGFDLGVGAIYLTVKGDTNRRLLLNSIGPVWDGNEVWLVTGGGALFAAFPDVYATVFSGFYPVVMLLIFTLVFRAVAIEFRSKESMPWWRNTWDRAFSFASIFIALLMGAALGNILTGVPLGPDKEFAGTLLDILHPFKLLVGITTVALFSMHGTIYAVLKTEGDLQEELKGKVNNTIVFFVITYAITTMATLIYYPHMSQPFVEQPFLFLLALANMLLVANIPREIYHGREFRAFLSSAGTIASLLMLFAIGIFPNLVLSVPYPEYSLTAYNAASSQHTLSIMLTMAIIGIPFVLAYTISIYWVFRGKVKLDSSSY